jgi:hypothetical protein
VDRDKRQKASDVFNDSNFFMARKSPFEEAFPGIDDIKVGVIESGDGVSEWNEKRFYTKEIAGEYINCSNTLCYNGGFSLGRIIRSMVYKKETEFKTSQMCQGNEGSPKGRRIYGKCCNFFNINVTIKYKAEGGEL